jgi:ribose transport system permease protein
MPTTIARRTVVLFLGNIVLLLAIWALLRQGGSFGLVLLRSGPDVAPVLLGALGMTGIVFTGAIDLSIGSIVAVAGTLFGILVHYGAPAWLCHLVCVGSALALALVNGVAIERLQIPAIIVTLVGLPLYRGLALIIADLGIRGFGGNISVQAEAFHLPGKVLAPWILFGAAGAALLWETQARTPRSWLALGSSEEACVLVGLSGRKIRLTAFLANGVFLGLAALLYVTRVQAIEPARIALGFELQVIGAVVLGGTNIFGGEGSYLGTLLGAFFLYFVSQVLTYAGASPYAQDAIAGAVIVIVIGLDCSLHRSRKWVEELA